MARVTVEDCLPAVDNRFDLVLVASRRARQKMVLVKTHKKRISSARWGRSASSLRDTSRRYERPDVMTPRTVHNTYIQCCVKQFMRWLLGLKVLLTRPLGSTLLANRCNGVP